MWTGAHNLLDSVFYCAQAEGYKQLWKSLSHWLDEAYKDLKKYNTIPDDRSLISSMLNQLAVSSHSSVTLLAFLLIR